MPDPMFDSLYRETGALVWPSADRLRHRGRQLRQRRLVVVAAAAVVVLLVGGTLAGQALGQRGAPPPPVTTGTPSTSVPSPSSSPPSDPTPTTGPAPTAAPTSRPPANPGTVPASAMLRLADVPSGYQLEDGEVDGDWTFAFSASGCQESGEWWTTPVVDSRDRAFRGGRDVSIVERVYLFGPGDGDGFLADVRAQVERCGGFRNGDGLTIVDEGFAGTDSIIVRAHYEGDSDALHVFVRQGDLVAEIWAEPTPDLDDVIGLAERAAARLCEATQC